MTQCTKGYEKIFTENVSVTHKYIDTLSTPNVRYHWAVSYEGSHSLLRKAFLSYKRKSKKFRPQISRLILYISENGLYQKIRHKPYFLTVSKYGEKVRNLFFNFFYIFLISLPLTLTNVPAAFLALKYRK